MEKLILHVGLLLLCFVTKAQSETIIAVYRLLPAKLIYNLSTATRDSLLEGKTYYPKSNTSDNIIAYNFGVSVHVSDYMYVSESYETGQRASGMIELRSIKMDNGDFLILISKTAGVWQVTYQQVELNSFIYNKKGKLLPLKKNLLPFFNEAKFMKPGTPASVKNEIIANSNMTFDLSREKVILCLNSNYLLNSENIKKWLKGDCLFFNWKQNRFFPGEVGFKE